jgi:stage II sporulation protein D
MRGFLILLIGLVIITLVLPVVLLYSCEIEIPMVAEVDTPSEQIVDANSSKEPTYIRVYMTKTKKVEQVELEEYVKSVIACEMPAAFEIDALKAQAVAARTKALFHKIKYGEAGHQNHPGAEVCSSTHCQVYSTVDTLIASKGADWYNSYWSKIEEAVESTRGLVLVYDNVLIDPLYHSSSGGKTEDSEDVFSTAVPYLRSVDSPYEGTASNAQKKEISIDKVIAKLNAEYKCGITKSNISKSLKILERSNGGRVARIKVGEKILTGRNVRDSLGLRSADFKITIGKSTMTFTTKGYGHGVGMSQYGANGMAKEGYTYNDILTHYYKGVDLVNF